MKQILVVGSDPRISQDLDRYLDPNEFKLLVSPQGKSLFTSLANVKPDLVILDLTDQSGREIAKKIREANSDLPLILLSKNPPHQEKDKSLVVVSPPIRMEKIAAMVKEALSLKSATDRQRVLLGSVRFSSRKSGRVDAKSDRGKSPEEGGSDNRDYQQVFEQTLIPIFSRIIRDCKGHIYDRLLSGLEKTMISEVLKYVNHNQVRASQLLGISRNTLRERMKRFDIY